MQTPPPDSTEPQRSGDGVRDGAAGFWDRYTGRSGGDAERVGGDPGQGGSSETGGGGGAERAGDGAEAAGPGEPGRERASDGQSEPTAGWPPHHHQGSGHQCLDWCPICRGAEMLRAAVPPELQAQFQLVQRDALLMAQAMIATQLERMRAQQDEPIRHPGPDDDEGIDSIPID